jgi:hypothetical protein
MMVDPGTPAGTRLRAADLVHSHARVAIEADMEVRLSKVYGEATRAARNGGRGTFDQIARERPELAA